MLKLGCYLKRFCVLVFIAIGFMAFQAVAELSLPKVMADMVNHGMQAGDINYVLKRGPTMIGLALFSALSSIGGSFFAARVAAGVGRDLRRDIFKKVTDISLDEFQEIGAASLITRNTNDITQIQNILVIMFRFMIYSPLMCIGGIVMAYTVDNGLTKILAYVLPLMLLFIIGISIYIMPMFTRLQKYVDRLNMIVRENLIGIRVIRAFNRQEYERNRFDEANKDLTDLAIRINKVMAATMPVVMLFMNVSALLIVWFGGLRASYGDIEVGSIMAFLQYAMQIMFSIVMMMMMFVMLPRAEASAVRINQVLNLENTVLDEGIQIPLERDGKVEFIDVTYRYKGAEEPALQGISFTAEPGQVTAIIGGTGSGKTTLVSLIPRLYDVESGSVKVNGIDVREQPLKVLRNSLGFVSQKATLFSGSISDNIRYGKENATDEEVRRAARIAQADGFIEEMAEGYDSIIAQGGTNVSGGQKQRISIARVLLRKPQIYVFDDSFSALDFKTDANLRKALKDEARGATQIVIAQRISTIMDADKIIVLDEGRIAGKGTHKELMKTCRIYREIAKSQLSEEELDHEQ
ncbi:MAG: ABC transporter ATP-binding protein [Anaerovoracaceae bacterium]|jgi:ATP-binding cassette subfamily B multidrug efflux pump